MSQPPPALADGSTNARPELSPHDRRRIAVAATCDPHCVSQYVLGKPMRSTTISRIERALRTLDFEHLQVARTRALAR